MIPRLVIVLALASVVVPGRATAERLPSPPARWIATTASASYEQIGSDAHGGLARMTGHALFGRGASYAAAIDLRAGALSGDFAYHAALLPLGIGLRVGDAGMIAAFAGLGVSGGPAPAKLHVPIELRARHQLGPLRLQAWAVARGQRAGGDNDVRFEGGAAVGWGRQQQYWQHSSSGSGPFVAVAARDASGDVALSIIVGLELLGAN